MEVLKKAGDIDINTQNVIIPFGLSLIPMKKLALISFEKHPDSIYIGLEPQYLDDVHGKGYRVIAYRCDGYVDVYDDINLNGSEDENFDVAGKGLCERKKVVMKNTVFEKKAGCIHISFSFTDKSGRAIDVKIIERTSKKTKGMNLIAPIGDSAENPSYLPLFFLYEFDFLRKYKTEVELTIDGKMIKLDDFPVPAPKDFQWRYYARYTLDCQIIEFANAASKVLEKRTPDASGLVVIGDLEYQYSGSTLKKITLQNSNHPAFIEFTLGFPDICSLDHGTEYVDTFKVVTDDKMGLISGDYSVTRSKDSVKIELTPSGGWTPVPNSLLTKVMFGKNSVFCSWLKTYRYTQNVELATLKSVSYWERIK